MAKTVVSALVGGFVGGVLVWISQKGSFRLAPAGMTYADLAATVLSGVSVLVTILGIFIAVLAIWGFAELKRITQRAAKDHVSDQLKQGELKTHVETIVGTFLTTELKAGKLRELVEERVDHVIFAGADERADAVRHTEMGVEEDEH